MNLLPRIDSIAGRRIIASAKRFNSRIPGRIFGSGSSSNEFLDSNADTDGSAQYQSQNQGQFAKKLDTAPVPSSLAFAEELTQEYTLSAFTGASSSPLSAEAIAVLSEPVPEELIEIKPDGSCYLPEVHYRRILNKAFGISGWSLIPRGPHSMQGNVLSREYALFANGKFISQARGHTTMTGSFQNPALCTEAVRSNALMRCCKDLGIAASLWDNQLMAQWKSRFALRKSISDYQGRQKTIWEKRRE